MRKLASIREIKEIHPIPNMDRIELAIIDGWQVIVKKGEYNIGDLTIYCEIDSILPEKPEFEFLRDKKFRIKTMKLRGTLSQGICFPLTIIPNKNYKIGDDVTDIIGIKKYESLSETEDTESKDKNKYKNPVIQYLLRFSIFRKLLLSKRKKYNFPDFISKTDETRIQNMTHLLNNKNIEYVVREKIDGQSGTFVVKKGKTLFGKINYEYIVCSRNLRLKNKEMSRSYWKVSEKYNIEKILIDLVDRLNVEWVAIQGECIDTNVQGNKYNIKEADLYVFNLITPNGKIECLVGEEMLAQYGLKWCPLIDKNYVLPDTVDELAKLVTGNSMLYPTLREGFVFRNYEKNISFKMVSPDFLIKNNE
jgi:hypothetical protein